MDSWFSHAGVALEHHVVAKGGAVVAVVVEARQIHADEQLFAGLDTIDVVGLGGPLIVLPVEGLGEAVGKLKQVYELLGVEAALAGAPVHEVAEVQAAHVAEHAVPRRADAEDLAALRHLLKRGVDVVIIPAGLGADDGGRAGEGAHGEGAGYLIELAVLADGVEEGLHDARTAAELLIRLYVGPQVLEKALVPEDVHRQGARHQNIRHGAGAYLRYELREAGGVVVIGVELGIVAHLDAVIAALAVEVEYLALDAVVEVDAGEGEGGLLRHLVIGGLLEGDEIGDHF